MSSAYCKFDHKCLECHKRYGSVDERARHPSECPVLYARNSGRDALEASTELKQAGFQGASPFNTVRCRVCYNAFQTRAVRDAHEATCGLTRSKCYRCLATFSDEESLKIHTANCASGGSYWRKGGMGYSDPYAGSSSSTWWPWGGKKKSESGSTSSGGGSGGSKSTSSSSRWSGLYKSSSSGGRQTCPRCYREFGSILEMNSHSNSCK